MGLAGRERRRDDPPTRRCSLLPPSRANPAASSQAGSLEARQPGRFFDADQYSVVPPEQRPCRSKHSFSTILAPPARDRKFADSPLERTGFEISVSRYVGGLARLRDARC